MGSGSSGRRARRWSDAALSRVAEGVHRFEHGGVNSYFVEEGGRLTLVDAGLPRSWAPMHAALARLGHRPDDLVALVLTHAHFDHVGTAARWQQEYGLPVLAHPGDRRLAAHPYGYAHERMRPPYPFLHPRAVPTLASMVRAGALRVRGLEVSSELHAGQELDVPGSPRVLFVPGHTAGHCALLLPGRDVVLTGDALVTLDPYTGRRGPRIVAGAATADSAQNLRSLDRIARTGARTLLPGHGEPWRGGAERAVRLARGIGAA